jgi:RimJ/RimL family protein N-acetyltransferase
LILYGHTEYVADWAARQLGIAAFGPCTTIAVVRNFEIVAAAVFHDYRPPNIEISFVTTDRAWSTPQFVHAVFQYPFDQLGCKRLTSITSASNQRARAFLCRLGFRQEGIHPEALPEGETAISYGLLASDAARWLRIGRVGKKLSISSEPA